MKHPTWWFWTAIVTFLIWEFLKPSHHGYSGILDAPNPAVLGRSK